MTIPVDGLALFMLGFLGSGHCIGMCGPLVVALPGQTARFSAHLAYHAGRLTTYVFIGALMGAAGRALIGLAGVAGRDPLVWMARTQLGIGLLAGLFLLLFGLIRLGMVTEPGWLTLPGGQSLWRGLLRRGGPDCRHRDLFGMGLTLGALPCGLSYAAFAQALGGGQVGAGALATLFFGLGTLPGLLAIGVSAAAVLARFRQQSDIVAGLIMIGMAAMLMVEALEGLI